MPLVLVIDDDRIQRVAAVHALGKAGFEVVEAGSGTGGLETARRLVPDAIVCDVVMPGLSGLELVAQLRQDDRVAGIPVLLVTTLAGREQVRQGMASGADDYLPKPYRFSELCEAVTALLARRAAHRRQAAHAARSDMKVALARQHERLSGIYEERLADELNDRWSQTVQTAGARTEEGALVALVDVMAPGALADAAPDAAALRRAYQQAGDALYVFGARQMVRHGHQLLALFDAQAAPMAVRAGFAVLAAQPATAAVVVHQGALALVEVADPLQLSRPFTLATGPALHDALQLLALARARGWKVSASAALLPGLQGAAGVGRREPLPAADHGAAPLEAVELTPLSTPPAA